MKAKHPFRYTFTDEELRRIAALLWHPEDLEEDARPASSAEAERCPECGVGEGQDPAGRLEGGEE